MVRSFHKVTVEINGRSFQVPEAITVVQALWYTGHRLIKGIGCLGGVCGACSFSYRRPKDPGVKTGLACQTLVEEGMVVSPPASIQPPRGHYRISEIQDPHSSLLKIS